MTTNLIAPTSGYRKASNTPYLFVCDDCGSTVRHIAVYYPDWVSQGFMLASSSRIEGKCEECAERDWDNAHP